jgi:hypothetical protein
MNEFSTTDFDDSEPGGSTSGINTAALDDLTRYSTDDFETINNPAGNTSQNYVTPGAYTMDASGVRTDLTGLSGLANTIKNFATDNKGLITAGGALLGLMGGNDPKYGKTGYQGTIPRLAASRTMVTAPPTRAQGYRPGAGGIDYGGDVTYTRMPAGSDPWSGLSGTTGTAANANTVPTSISNIVTGNTGGTNTGGTNTGGITGLTQAQKDALAVENWRKSLTPQQYLSSINQWIADNPNMSKADLDAAMAKFKVTQTDLQTALGANKALSAADIYALSHGMGLKEANAQQTAGITKFIQDNPYATAKQIQDAIKTSGVNTGDIKQALTGTKLSKGYQEALLNGMGLDAYYNNINKFLTDQAKDTTTSNALEESARAKAKEDFGVSDADIAAAQKFLTTDAGKTALEAAYTPQLPKSTAGMTESDIFKLYDAQRDAGFTDAQLRETAAKQYGTIKDEDWNYIKSQAGYAAGGEIAMAKGRYLQGQTDGMADKLPAQIGADQPAALSHGEFVIPADVVSHMGNGNSDAGAKKLYQMMDKIRMARTGTKKQGKKINPDKFMPGGLASSKYAAGGSVKKFQTGGATGVGAAANAGVTGVESNLSNWAGDYVTNMLGQGQALANLPYTAYMGPLTAGASPLQTGAFQTATGLTTPTSIGTAAKTAGDISTKAQGLTYAPTTSTFDATQAASYMNPYLESALKPQLDEARRQSQITQQQNAAKMTSAGAFGGGRQAILDAETQRNLATTQAGITGQGYSTAYDKAMAQFNADQARKAQEAQFGATYGLQGLQTGLQGAQAQGNLGATEAQTGLANLKTQLDAGAVERGIESEGIAADKAAFEEARANPYKMVQFQQSLLQGLPLAAQSYNMTAPSTLTQAAQGATTVADLLDILSGKAPAKKA